MKSYLKSNNNYTLKYPLKKHVAMLSKVYTTIDLFFYLHKKSLIEKNKKYFKKQKQL